MANLPPNFATILSESPTEVERPKNLPIGTYLCIVGQWETGTSSKKKTPFVKFPLKPIAAQEDVDETELAEIGGLENRNLSITLYATDDAKFMIDDFQQNCGVDLTDGRSRGDRLDDCVNANILAVVEHEIDENDPSRVFTRVRRTALAE